MALTLSEWFGYDIADWSEQAIESRQAEYCPFIEHNCTKFFSDGTKSGACSAAQADLNPVIICPNRLYAGKYRILSDVADVAFGAGKKLLHPDQLHQVDHDGSYVVAFGKRFGKELQLPRSNRGRTGGYFVDWILARIGVDAELAEFVAVEVQTIDTTGSYRPAVESFRQGDRTLRRSVAGFNWENVNKRILPQLIYKGHVLRLERLCTKGLFFICPGAVYRHVDQRLGAQLREYTNLHPGSISFRWYDLGPFQPGGRQLVFGGQFSTTVDQLAHAFTAPVGLPAAGVYEQAIRRALARSSHHPTEK